jgi:hypothetical protein
MRRWLLDVTRRPVVVQAIADGAGGPNPAPIRMSLGHGAHASPKAAAPGRARGVRRGHQPQELSARARAQLAP